MNAFTVTPVLGNVTEQRHVVDEPSPSTLDDESRSQSFGPLEWLVIALGQRDGTSPFRSRHLLQAVGRLFACAQPNQLANVRLEALRRMAALASERFWHVPPSEMAAFLRAGWSEEQLELLIEKVFPEVAHDRAPPSLLVGPTHTLPSYCSLQPDEASTGWTQSWRS